MEYKGAGQPRVCTVTQTPGEADSLSESSDDSGDRGNRQWGRSRSRKFHMPKLSFNGDHWNGFQFQLVAKNLKWSERKKLREFPKETDLEWLIKKFCDHYGSCEQALRLEWQQSDSAKMSRWKLTIVVFKSWWSGLCPKNLRERPARNLSWMLS